MAQLRPINAQLAETRKTFEARKDVLRKRQKGKRGWRPRVGREGASYLATNRKWGKGATKMNATQAPELQEDGHGGMIVGAHHLNGLDVLQEGIAPSLAYANSGEHVRVQCNAWYNLVTEHIAERTRTKRVKPKHHKHRNNDRAKLVFIDVY